MKKISKMNSGLFNILMLFSSQMAGQVFLVGSAVVIAVLFSEKLIGEFALFFTFVTVSTSVAALRLEWALVNTPEEERIELCTIGLLVTLSTSLLATAIFHVVSVTAIAPFQEPLKSYTPLVFLSILFGSAGQLCLYLLVARQSFGRLSWFNFLNQFLRAVFPVALVLGIGRDPYLLAIGEVLARAVILAIFLTPFLRVLWAAVPALSPGRVRHVLRRNWKFVAISAPSSLMNALSTSIMVFLVGARFGVEASGAIWFTQRLLAIPLSLMAKAIGDFYHGRLGAFREAADPAGAKRLFRKLAAVLAVCSLFIFVAALFVPAVLCGFGLADNWSLALSVTPYFVALPMAQMLSAPLSRSILVTNQQEKKLVFDVLSLATAYTASFWAGWMAFPVEFSVLSIAVAQAVAALVYVMISYRSLDHLPSSKPARPGGT